MPLDDTQREKLKAFRDAETKRENEAKEAAEVRELAVHELRAKVADGGKRVEGKDFVILDNPRAEHVYALRCADNQGVLAWRRADKEDRLLDGDHVVDILRHYIIASSSGAADKAAGIEWSQACGGGGLEGLIWQTARAFARLMGSVEDGKQKK